MAASSSGGSLKSNSLFNFRTHKQTISHIRTFGEYVYEGNILVLIPNDSFYESAVEFVLSLILTIDIDETPQTLIISKFHDVWSHVLKENMIENPLTNTDQFVFIPPDPQVPKYQSDIVVVDLQPDSPHVITESPLTIYVCEVAKLKTPPKIFLCKCIKQIYKSEYDPKVWHSSELYKTLTVSDLLRVINTSNVSLLTYDIESMTPEEESETVLIKSRCSPQTILDHIINSDDETVLSDDEPPPLLSDESDDDESDTIPYDSRSKNFNSIIYWTLGSEEDVLTLHEDEVDGVGETINTFKLIMVRSEELDFYANSTLNSKKYFEYANSNGYTKLKERLALEFGRKDVIYITNPRDLHVAVKRRCPCPIVVIIYKNIHELNAVYSAFNSSHYQRTKTFGGFNFNGKQMSCASLDDILEFSALTGNKLKSFAISASNLVRAAVYTKLLNNMNVTGKPSKRNDASKVNLTARLYVALCATQAKNSASYLLKPQVSTEELNFDYPYFLEITENLRELYAKAVEKVSLDILRIILSPTICRQAWNGVALKKEWLYFGAIYEIYTYTNDERNRRRDIDSEMPKDFETVDDKYKSAYLTMWMIKKSTNPSRCGFTVTTDKTSGILTYVMNDGKMVIVGAYGLRVTDLLEMLFYNNVKTLGYITPLSLAPKVIAHQISVASHRLGYNSFVYELQNNEPIGYISYYTGFKFRSQTEVSQEELISSLNIISN